jgi:hypothetical protein
MALVKHLAEAIEFQFGNPHHRPKIELAPECDLLKIGKVIIASVENAQRAGCASLLRDSPKRASLTLNWSSARGINAG